MTERRLVALALAVSVGVAVGFVVQALGEPAYRAEAVLQVAPPGTPAGTASAADTELLAESYARLVGQRAFLDGIVPRVGGGELDADELARRVRAARPDGTALVVVEAEGASRAEARGLAEAVAAALVALPQEAGHRAAIAAPATESPHAVAPSLLQNLAAGVALGLVGWTALLLLDRTPPQQRAERARPGAQQEHEHPRRL